MKKEKINHNECRDGKMVLVKIPEDLSCTGYAKFKYVLIDSCIAPIVEALQKGAIDMRGSCCGHGKIFGDIHLQDKRVLVIFPDDIYYDEEFKKGLERLYEKIKRRRI